MRGKFRQRPRVKIHFTGIPCKTDKRLRARYHSIELSSNPDRRRVTCLLCQKCLQKGDRD